MTAISALEIEQWDSVRTPYIVLTLSGFNLVLPQSDVYTLESRSDMLPAPGEDRTAGRINADDQSWPVVCFGNDFEVTTIPPEESRICVLLHHAGNYVGLLCEAVQALDREQAEIFSLPPALRAEGSPVRGLVIAEHFFGLLTGSAELAALFPDVVMSSSAATTAPTASMETYS